MHPVHYGKLGETMQTFILDAKKGGGLCIHNHVEKDLDIWKHLFHPFILKKDLWSHQEYLKRPLENMRKVSAWFPKVQCNHNMETLTRAASRPARAKLVPAAPRPGREKTLSNVSYYLFLFRIDSGNLPK